MANAKRISLFHSSTGRTMYCIVRHWEDNYSVELRLDSSDGLFKANPVNPYLMFVEHPTINGLYEILDSREVWADGKYELFAYEQAGGLPAPATDKQVGGGEMFIESDAEKTVLTPVTVSSAQITAGVLNAAVTEGHIVSWARGDADRLAVSLGAAYAKSGARFYLCIKSSRLLDNASAIVNREITITDAANVVGYIDLTADEMQTVGRYYAEIERRDDDSVSNPKTCWQAKWEIFQDVRR